MSRSSRVVSSGGPPSILLACLGLVVGLIVGVARAQPVSPAVPQPVPAASSVDAPVASAPPAGAVASSAPPAGAVASSAPPAGAVASSAPEPPPVPTTDETATMGGEYRKLNGHNLIRPAAGMSAVTNTSFGIIQGLGLDTFEGTSVLTSTPQVAHLLTYGQTLSGQLAFYNRVALELSLGGLAAIGGDLDAILMRGAFAGLDVRALAKLRMFTLDEVGLQATGGVGLRYRRQLALTPGVVVERALSDPASLADVESIRDQMLQQTDALSVVPALMLAEGFGALGLQLSGGPALSVYGSDGRHGVIFNAHAALDLRNATDLLPVALTAEYGLEHAFPTGNGTAPGTGAETIHTVVGGLFYSGRRDLELGATFTASPRPHEQLMLASMVMHYYF